MDLSKLPSLKHVITSFELSTRKSLGQHFLLDESITDKIALYAGDLRDTNVIEVGPGPGGLTRSILKAGAKKLYVIEKDDRCIAIMEQLRTVAADRLEILHADALEIDVIATVEAPRKIVANLPYNSGTMMLIHWLEAIYTHGPNAFTSLTLMFLLDLAMPLWVAALIVTVLWAAVGAFLYTTGRKTLKTVSPAPTQTVNSLKETF